MVAVERRRGWGDGARAPSLAVWWARLAADRCGFRGAAIGGHMEFSADFRWRFSGAVRRNDNRRTRTHAPSGVNLNTSVNMPAAERPRGGKPRGLTL